MVDPTSSLQAHNRPNHYLDLIPAYLCLYASIGVMYPYLVLWMREAGMTDRQVAWILAASGLSMIITSQFWGYVADIVSTPLRVLLATTIAMAFVYLLYPASLALDRRFPMFPLFGALFGLGMIQSFINMPRPEMLNSLLMRAEHGPENFSMIRAFGSLGFIMLNLPMGYMARRSGLGVQFPIFFLINLLFAVLLLRLRDTPLPGHFHRLRFMELQRYFATNPLILLFLLMVLVYQSGHGLSVLYLSLLLKDMGAGSDTIAWFFSYGAMVEIPLFFIGDRLIRKLGPLPLIGSACLCQLTRWLIVHFSTNITVLFLTQTFHAVTFGLFYASVVIYMTGKTPPEIRSSALTLLSISFYGLSGLVGNFAGGQVAGMFGLRNFYLFSSAVALAAFILLLLLVRLERRGASIVS